MFVCVSVYYFRRAQIVYVKMVYIYIYIYIYILIHLLSNGVVAKIVLRDFDLLFKSKNSTETVSANPKMNTSLLEGNKFRMSLSLKNDERKNTQNDF